MGPTEFSWRWPSIESIVFGEKVFVAKHGCVPTQVAAELPRYEQGSVGNSTNKSALGNLVASAELRQVHPQGHLEENLWLAIISSIHARLPRDRGKSIPGICDSGAPAPPSVLAAAIWGGPIFPFPQSKLLRPSGISF